jgi:hypothetical protein
MNLHRFSYPVGTWKRIASCLPDAFGLNVVEVGVVVVAFGMGYV